MRHEEYRHPYEKVLERERSGACAEQGDENVAVLDSGDAVEQILAALDVMIYPSSHECITAAMCLQ